MTSRHMAASLLLCPGTAALAGSSLAPPPRAGSILHRAPCPRCAEEPPRRVSFLEGLLFGREGRPDTATGRLPPRNSGGDAASADAPKKSRYVAPEDDPNWNRNSTRMQTKDAQTKWEERVQYDALKEGNALNQNDILQKEIGRNQ